MSSKDYTEEFEQAFEKVFGKDRDLSELSYIDMSDFKEVMREAVVQFDKTAPPEPEECHDIVYIFWRVYRTVHRLLLFFQLEESLNILGKENFYILNDKETIVQAAYNNKLFTIPSNRNISKITKNYIDNWERNKQHLIETGYTKTLILEYKWIDGLFRNLYPDRLLLKMNFLRYDKYGDLFFEYYWKDYNTPSRPEHDYDYEPVASYYKNDPTAPQPPPDKADDFNYKYDYQYASSIFPESSSLKRMRRLTEDITEREIEEASTSFLNYYRDQRIKYYDVFMEIFQKLFDSLGKRGLRYLLNECMQTITKRLSLREIVFSIISDRNFYSFRLEDEDKNQWLPSFGGLSKLFQLIGYYEREGTVSCNMQNSLRKEIKIIEIPTGDNFLYHAIHVGSYAVSFKKTYVREKLDASIANCQIMEEKEKKFWESYYLRLNKLLENVIVDYNKLESNIDNKEDINLKNHYKPFLKTVADDIKAQYLKQDLFPEKQSIEKVPSTKTIDTEQKSKKKRTLPYKRFPTTKGTTWDQVALIVYKSHLRVVVGNESEVYNIGEIGFPHEEDEKKDIKLVNKTKTINRNWVFLNFLAENNGVINSIRAPNPESIKQACEKALIDSYGLKPLAYIFLHLKKYASNIRVILKYLLQLDGDPIPPDRVTRYDTEWKLQCRIAKADWRDVLVTLEKDGFILFDTCELYKQKVHLSELGFLGKNGRYNKQGKVFFKLISSVGGLSFEPDSKSKEDNLTLLEYDIAEKDIIPKICGITKIEERPFLLDSKSDIYKILFKSAFQKSIS